jgi:hypothetical protein
MTGRAGTTVKRSNPYFGAANSLAAPVHGRERSSAAFTAIERPSARGSFVTHYGHFVADTIDPHSRPKQADSRRYVSKQRDPRHPNC